MRDFPKLHLRSGSLVRYAGSARVYARTHTRARTCVPPCDFPRPSGQCSFALFFVFFLLVDGAFRRSEAPKKFSYDSQTRDFYSCDRLYNIRFEFSKLTYGMQYAAGDSSDNYISTENKSCAHYRNRDVKNVKSNAFSRKWRRREDTWYLVYAESVYLSIYASTRIRISDSISCILNRHCHTHIYSNAWQPYLQPLN